MTESQWSASRCKVVPRDSACKGDTHCVCPVDTVARRGQRSQDSCKSGFQVGHTGKLASFSAFCCCGGSRGKHRKGVVWGALKTVSILQDADRLWRQEHSFLRGWENLPDSDRCPRMGMSAFRGDERVVAGGHRETNRPSGEQVTVLFRDSVSSETWRPLFSWSTAQWPPRTGCSAAQSRSRQRALSPDSHLSWGEGGAALPAPYCLGKPRTSVRLGCWIWKMGMGHGSLPSGPFVIRLK